MMAVSKKERITFCLCAILIGYLFVIIYSTVMGALNEKYAVGMALMPVIPLYNYLGYRLFIILPYNKVKLLLMGKRKRRLINDIYRDINDMYQVMRLITYSGIREAEEIDVLYEKLLSWDNMSLRFIHEEVKYYQKAKYLFRHFFNEYYINSNGHLAVNYKKENAAASLVKDAEELVFSLSTLLLDLWSIIPVSGIFVDENSVVDQVMRDWDSGRIKLDQNFTEPLEYPIGNWAIMDNSALFSLANEYFSKMTFKGRIWGYHLFYYGPFIPRDILEESKRGYANYNPENEHPILLTYSYKVSYFTGFLVTNKYFYFQLSPEHFKKPRSGKILLTDIGYFQIKKRLFQWIVINKHLQLKSTSLTKADRKAINELMNIFTTKLHDGISSEDIIDKPLKPFTRIPIKKGSSYEAWVDGLFHTSGRPKKRW
ncbi:MAG: hypothetical protein ABFD08_10045 [Syntrophomonas sp.]